MRHIKLAGAAGNINVQKNSARPQLPEGGQTKNVMHNEHGMYR